MARIMCIGHAVQDYVFGVPALPKGGRKFRATRFESVGGGPAATAAVAISRLGGAASLAARVGDDPIADAIIAELQGYGVRCDAVRKFPGRASSLSAVMIDDDGERMIVNYRDDQLPADASWLPTGLTGVCEAVLADTRWPEGAAAGLLAARRSKLPGVLDADAPVPDNQFLLSAASHVAFSADGLTGLMETEDLREGLSRFHARYGVWCCVTDGARGVLCIDGGKFSSVGAYRAEVVDTLGAGDVWHGAFALALGEGAGEPDAVRFASAAAAIKVTRIGGRRGAPDRAEVDHFMMANEPMEPMI